MKIKCSVEDKGYLTKRELIKMGGWKRHTLPSQMVKNPDGHVEKITAEVFSLDDDWEKLEKLMDRCQGLDGVRQPVASTILHLYDPERYPIFDIHALRSIRIKKEDVEGDKKFWEKYVKFCRAKAECHGVCMRTLDRALYKFSEADAAAILKIMPEEMLLTELTRRGYTESDPQENNTQKAKIVKTQ